MNQPPSRSHAPLLLAGLLCLTLISSAVAHPVPKDEFDRKIKVKLTRCDKNRVQILIAYRLELDELTAIKEALDNFGDELDVAAAKDKRKAVYDKFTEKFGPILADNVAVQVNGKIVPLKVTSHNHQLNDEKGQPLGHVRCDFVFTGTVDVTQEQEHRVNICEGNYSFPSPRRGMIDLSIDADPSVPLDKIKQPGEALKQKPFADLGPGEEEKLRQASAAFTLPNLDPLLAGAGLVALADSPPGQGPLLVTSALSLVSLPKTESPLPEEAKTGQSEPVLSSSQGKAGTVAGHHEKTPLADLFSGSGFSTWALLLLALLFGGAHALTPGHGKTLMAAYLVGENGTMLHALVLGLVTTLTHTGAVIIVAIALRFVPVESAIVALQGVQVVFGLLIICIGLWLLLRRLSGRTDHFHLGGGHHHHHDHGHHHDHAHADHDHDEHGNIIPRPQAAKVSAWRLIVLGMQGGIVPCWDAVIMLFVAVATGLLWLALPMLLVFSLGLAGVLVAVGIAVVSVKQFAQSRWGDSRLVKALPVISACVVIALGFWLCYGGVHG